MTALAIILPDESDALAEEGVHSIDRAVFHALVLATEWASGIIGSRHRVSYGRLAVYLSENIPRKAKGAQVVVAPHQVRNAVSRLCAIGVFKRLPVDDGYLRLSRVFWAELLVSDSSVQNPVVTQLAGLLSAVRRNNSSKSNELQSCDDSSCRGDDVPVVTYNNIHTYKHARKNSGVETQPLAKSWRPDDQAWEYLSIYHGKGPKLEERWTAEFVMHWLGSGERRSANGWSKAWAHRMSTLLKNPGMFDGFCAGKAPSKPERSGGYSGSRRADVAGSPHQIEAPPMDDEMLSGYARAHGFPSSPVGASSDEYRRLLESARRLVNEGVSKSEAIERLRTVADGYRERLQ